MIWAFPVYLLAISIATVLLTQGLQIGPFSVSASSLWLPTLIIAVFFFSGLQLFFFGVLGEYISAIHFQVRKRPLVIERERINFDKNGASAVPSPSEK